MNHSGRLGLACQTSCSCAIFLDAETLLRTCLCFACAITRSTFLSTKLDRVSICLSVYIHYFSIYLGVTLHMKSHSSFLSQPLIWIWEQKLVYSIWFWSDSWMSLALWIFVHLFSQCIWTQWEVFYMQPMVKVLQSAAVRPVRSYAYSV